MRRRSSDSVKIFYPKYDKEFIVRHVKMKMAEVPKEIEIHKVILFGSYAKGNYTAASDIDLLIVYKGRLDRGEVYNIIWDILDLSNLQLHIYKYEDFKEMLRDKNSFIMEVLRTGIKIL